MLRAAAAWDILFKVNCFFDQEETQLKYYIDTKFCNIARKRNKDGTLLAHRWLQKRLAIHNVKTHIPHKNTTSMLLVSCSIVTIPSMHIAISSSATV